MKNQYLDNLKEDLEFEKLYSRHSNKIQIVLAICIGVFLYLLIRDNDFFSFFNVVLYLAILARIRIDLDISKIMIHRYESLISLYEDCDETCELVRILT